MPDVSPTARGPKILIVDDDEPTRLAYAQALRGAGYEVVEARDGLAALEIAARELPALILLDVDMPVLDGWQTLQRLQQANHQQPVIMLTGATQVEERVKGLSAGADDYLGKPCDYRELLARVHSVLRRSRPQPTVVRLLQFGGTVVDLANRTAVREGQPVGLTRTEYALLEMFAQHPGELVTREAMLESIWGYDARSNTRTVETHIWRLRLKLNDTAGDPRWIQTVAAGSGYRMVCEPVAGWAQ